MNWISALEKKRSWNELFYFIVFQMFVYSGSPVSSNCLRRADLKSSPFLNQLFHRILLNIQYEPKNMFLPYPDIQSYLSRCYDYGNKSSCDLPFVMKWWTDLFRSKLAVPNWRTAPFWTPRNIWLFPHIERWSELSKMMKSILGSSSICARSFFFLLNDLKRFYLIRK